MASDIVDVIKNTPGAPSRVNVGNFVGQHAMATRGDALRCHNQLSGQSWRGDHRVEGNCLLPALRGCMNLLCEASERV